MDYKYISTNLLSILPSISMLTYETRNNVELNECMYVCINDESIAFH